MEPVRIGIIGAARVARYAVIAAARTQPRASVVAVAARDPARAAAYAAEEGIARVHADYAALCADPEVDLVYVATPPRFHLAHARLAIAAGKPVLVEKPFAMDAPEARTLLDDAAAAGVPVFEAMHSRCHAIWPRIAELLPALGRIEGAEAVFDVAVSTAEDEFRWDATLGGGALMDLGIYPLAWLRAALTVTGSAGTLVVTNPLAPQHGHDIALTTAAGTTHQSLDAPGSYDAQLAAVVGCLCDGARWPLPADDAWRSMQAIDAVRAAALTEN